MVTAKRSEPDEDFVAAQCRQKVQQARCGQAEAKALNQWVLADAALSGPAALEEHNRVGRL